MSEPEDIQPVFPPEIEEIIFSLCTQSDLEKSGNLILVAKRVYHWLRPQLYGVAIFYDDKIPGRLRFQSDLLKVHGQHVRHLLFWDIVSQDTCYHDPATCLSWCPNVVNVAFWSPGTVYDEALVNKLLSLHLTHLSFDVSSFHSAVTHCSLSTQLTFTFVTHLELIGLKISPTANDVERYFPSVTHMALNANRGLSAQNILKCWKGQLEVLVLYLAGSTSVGDSGIDPRISGYVPNDPRVVVMPQIRGYVHDWNETTQNGPESIWRKAEGVIKRRRREGVL
ncbi:hypothetical protein BDN72DRAFT_850022 [Pluteus cervinus]|uniref:Uncharacterized protein n=1 Tax=Pluteus cervinus TaxID=181527 RepID=A0ACD3A5R5_9AGAR|nr:hypothetical protein BDN72DRAFT_850022 [Pluteus cervinus]